MHRFVPFVLAIAMACLLPATGPLLAQEDPTFEAAKRLFQEKEYQAAAEKCGEILEVYPDYSWGWHCVGVGRWDRGELDRAESALRTALSFEPGSFESRYVLGRVLADRKEYGEAAAELERAVDTAADARQRLAASSALADARFRAGEYDRARSLLEALLQDDPEAFRPRYMLGLTCRRLDDLPCAIEQLRKARALRPDNPGLARMVAELSAHAAGNGSPGPPDGSALGQAIRDAEAWVESGSDGPDAGVHLVDLLVRAGRFEEAARRAEDFATEYPDRCDLPVHAARAHDRLGNSGAALDWSARALECDPQSADAWHERARAALDEARALIGAGELIEHEERIEAMLAVAGEALSQRRSLRDDDLLTRTSEEAAAVETAFRAALTTHRKDAADLVAANREQRCQELRVKWWTFLRDEGPPLSAEERSYLQATCDEDLQ